MFSDSVDVTCSYVEGPAALSRYSCRLGNIGASETGTVRIVARDSRGSNARTYRIAQRNDPRNVPVPFDPASASWWQFPDNDEDGIPDHWEENGVWVDGEFLDLPGGGADPDHMDLFIYGDYETGEQYSQRVVEHIERTFAESPMGNPDGTSGISVHYEHGRDIPTSIIGDEFCDCADGYRRVATYSGFAQSPKAGSSSVPQLYKYVLNVTDLDHLASEPGKTVIGLFAVDSRQLRCHRPQR